MYGELQEESSHLASSDDVTGAMSCKFKVILTYNFETERILGLPRHLFYINLVRNNETENVKGFIKKLNCHVGWTFSGTMKQNAKRFGKNLNVCLLNFFYIQNNE